MFINNDFYLFLFQEHSFEVSLFAELFNEMLMRDFGFNIYKAMIAAPEKAKENKDDKVIYQKIHIIHLIYEL
jgi:hypothetical protein